MSDVKWKLVPVEPTEAMIEAHFEAHAKAKTVFADVPEIWSAMLAAAPSPAESLPSQTSGAEAVAWVIPGDDNAREDGSIDAMAWREGEFTRPLYALAKPASEPAR